ncbi:MAG: insulinase family protein [Phycisphaerales bacterium]|nr:insulinase family protein [Phycisphaerales bacterium]
MIAAAKRVLMVLGVLWTAAAAAAGGPPDNPRTFALDNGLRVVLTPLPRAADVTVNLSFAHGWERDPGGRSGLAHFVEHLVCTAATPSTPARDPDRTMKGWNGQTLRRWTYYSLTVAPDEVEGAVRDAAERMDALDIRPSDIERERGRIARELANMHGGQLALGAVNHARALADRLPEGAQRGGDIGQIRAITLEEARAFHEAYNRPNHAVLSVAGKFDGAAVETLVRERFGAIAPGGAALPPVRPAGERALGPGHQALAKAGGGFPDGPPHAAVAFAMPAPDSPDFAAGLVLSAAAQQAAVKTGKMSMTRQTFPPFLEHAPLLDDHVLCLVEPADDAEKPTADPLLKWATEHLTGLDEAEFTAAKFAAPGMYGLIFGLTPQDPRAFPQVNTFFIAITRARQAHFPVDGPKLMTRLAGLTREEVNAVAARLFAAERAGMAVVMRGGAEKGGEREAPGR